MTVNPRYACGSGLLASVGVHSLALAGLSSLPAEVLPIAEPRMVEISIAEPELPQAPDPLPEVESEPKGPSPSVPAVPEARAIQDPPPAARTEVHEPASTEPIELPGTTLTAEGGGWEAAPGSGRPSSGPIRAGRGPASSPAPARAGAKSPHGPATVPVTSLATPPRAPNLNATLARNYPAAARTQGIGGDAVVRVRIGPNGRVAEVTVLSESFPGFGAACQATVQGSRWSPPQLADGRRVGTVVRYRCRFRVES